MGFWSAIFGGDGASRLETSSSELSKRIGNRYADILAYFGRHPWGEKNVDKKIINTLPFPDRVIIIEKLFKERKYVSIDEITLSLTVAYFWIGFKFYNDFNRWAQPFAEVCFNRGLVSAIQHDRMIDKIRELAFTADSSQYTEYKYAKEDLEYYAPKCEMRDLALQLCEKYKDDGLMVPLVCSSPSSKPERHPCYEQDLKDFVDDRALFLKGI